MHKSVFLVSGIIVFIVIVLGVLMYTTSYQKNTSKNDGKLVVSATIFPLYDIVRTVAGDAAYVELLLPPGASPHFYEFTPQQIQNLQNVSVGFFIGHGADDWAQDPLKAMGGDIVIVDKDITLRTRKQEHGHTNDQDFLDPHYWLDMHNGTIIAQTVADVLAQKDPQNASIYQSNAHRLIQEITAKDNALQKQTENLSHKDMITLHDAWYYFADHFGLHIVGTFMPQAGEDPSPQYLAELAQAARTEGGGVIFSEPQLSNSIIETFAKDNDLTIAIIDPIGGTEWRDSYIDLMVYNVNTIVNAFEKNE